MKTLLKRHEKLKGYFLIVDYNKLKMGIANAAKYSELKDN